MNEATVNITIKTVPHPDPKQAVDIFARLVVKELLKSEEQTK